MAGEKRGVNRIALSGEGRTNRPIHRANRVRASLSKAREISYEAGSTLLALFEPIEFDDYVVICHFRFEDYL
jgi:hypothetical protein